MAWTRFAFLQVFINVVRASEFREIAQRTAAKLFGHVDNLIAKARSNPENNTLLGCMIDRVPGDLSFDEFSEHNERSV